MTPLTPPLMTIFQYDIFHDLYKNTTVLMKPKTLKILAGAGGATVLGGLLWALSGRTSQPEPPSPKNNLKNLLRDTFLEQQILSQTIQTPADQSRLQQIRQTIQVLQDQIAKKPKIQKIIAGLQLKDTKEALTDSMQKIQSSLAKLTKQWMAFGITPERKQELEAKMAEKLSMRAIIEAALKE